MSDSAAPAEPRRRQVRPFHQDPAKLRRRRVAAGLSLTALARLAGYSKGHLSECENPGYLRSMSPESLLKVAGVLGCETTDLMPDEPGHEEKRAIRGDAMCGDCGKPWSLRHACAKGSAA